MNSKYFCVYHAQRLQAHESEAINAWSQIMRQALRAYTECRTSDADTYLNAAIDIALLRSECELNGIFSDLHLIKPAEFLIQLYIAEQRFDEAAVLLARLSARGTLPAPAQGPTLVQFSTFERMRISAAEMAQRCKRASNEGKRDDQIAESYAMRRH